MRPHRSWTRPAILLTAVPFLSACASRPFELPSPDRISYAQNEAPASWATDRNELARLLSCYTTVTDSAHRVESIEAFASTIDLSAPCCILIGEAHADPAPAHALAHAILDRSDATTLVLWEEGEEWHETAQVRLRGLMTRQWSIDTDPAHHEVIAGGSWINRELARRVTEHPTFPPRVLVYAGASHLYFHPDLPNPYPPSVSEPLLTQSASSWRRVAAVIAQPPSTFIDRADSFIAQAIVAQLGADTLDIAAAARESQAAAQELERLTRRLEAIAPCVAPLAPDTTLLIAPSPLTRQPFLATTALARVLGDERCLELLRQHREVVFAWATYPLRPTANSTSSAPSPMYEFELRCRGPISPSDPRTRPAIIRISASGLEFTPPSDNPSHD